MEREKKKKNILGAKTHNSFSNAGEKVVSRDKQANDISTDSVMKLVFEIQGDRVTTNQGSHLQKPAGTVLSLADWNDLEHQETNGRETHLSNSNTAGVPGTFIYLKHTKAPKRRGKDIYVGILRFWQ